MDNECLKQTRFRQVLDKDVLDILGEIDNTIINEGFTIEPVIEPEVEIPAEKPKCDDKKCKCKKHGDKYNINITINDNEVDPKVKEGGAVEITTEAVKCTEGEDWSTSQTAEDFRAFRSWLRNVMFPKFGITVISSDDTEMPMTIKVKNANGNQFTIEYDSEHLTSPKDITVVNADNEGIFSDRVNIPSYDGSIDEDVAYGICNAIDTGIDAYAQAMSSEYECLKQTRFRQVIDKDILDLFKEIDTTIANESK